MRPVFRGPVPIDENGQIKVVSDYKDWRMDLIDRIGNYCSYCDMVLNDSPQVEHVVPKNPQPNQPQGSLLAWDNMVLACGPCNRAKSNNPCGTDTHYLPDFHNTILAFETRNVSYRNKNACIITVKSGLTPAQAIKGQNTVNLCQLDKVVVTPRATDLRWKYRFEALQMAKYWRNEWNDWGKTTPAFLKLLQTAAISKGFFMVWYEVFSDVPTVVKALLEAFPNTAVDCFDEQQGYGLKRRNPVDF